MEETTGFEPVMGVLQFEEVQVPWGAAGL